MFTGRQKELAQLNKLYNSDKFEFAVIYGRRRVGKSALITEFIKDKDAIFFTGIESNALQNLEIFSRTIMEFETGMAADKVFSSFQEALEHVFLLAETRRIVLCIDEYPYVAKSAKSLASILQLLIDRFKDTSKLFLILCGSSVTYMEEQVLSSEAMLSGHRTAQMKITPFSFGEACQFVPRFSAEEKALAYGITGGIPHYLLQLDDNLSIEENIRNTFFNPSSVIFEEPLNLLKQEVREPAIYNSILSAIASGASKMSEISKRVGEETSVCTAYIRNLIDLGIIRKETPLGDSSTRKTVYTVDDNMFRFWYRFVPENASTIALGAVDLAYRRIERHLPEYMEAVFEEICRQYLLALLLADRCAVDFTESGRWWGTNPKTRKQEKIDILGTMDKYSALFGECKWSEEKIDVSALEKLLDRSNLFSFQRVHFYLFAKNGFTQDCIDKAREYRNVTLVTYEDILKWLI